MTVESLPTKPATRKPLRIEDYAMIGDQMTAALVGRNGSIDWLCLPRFDGGACFAALLGDSDNGSWLIAPRQPDARITRSYRDDTMIVETVFETRTGSAVVIDFMVPQAEHPTLVRLVQGRAGHVAMHTDMALRFDYGVSIPWVTRLEGEHGLCAIAGPDMVVLRSPVKLHGRDMHSVAQFEVRAGEAVGFLLVHGASHRPRPSAPDPIEALARTQAYWEAFIGRCRYTGKYKAQVHRSLLTLKALTYAPTGGIVAAPTTSLPEQLGGARNWDYRYCWLRDASLTLFALMGAGFTDEASQWRDWLQRSIAGSADQIQIMYGLHGERALDERDLPWLAGYEGSRPVRVGNAASAQVQLDVYGEVLECLHQARRSGLKAAPHGWSLQRNIVTHMAAIWDKPDEGMWEIRGEPQQFTLSKIMAWAAIDCMIRDAVRYNLSGPVDDWRALREEIAARVLREGYDPVRNTFVQSFGGKELDASLLLIPVTGFLPADDPKMLGTVKAIEEDLLRGGFVLRYRTDSHVDGLAGDEGAFLACTFWLVEVYALQGRHEDAEMLFDRLLGLCNDVGLLAEEYDPEAKRLVGNFPQAFSHVALIAAAMAVSGRNVGHARRTRHQESGRARDADAQVVVDTA